MDNEVFKTSEESDDNVINFITFNQDCTSLAVGTKTGYRLYSLNSVDKLELIYTQAIDDVILVERLFSSSLLALVSKASPRKLKVCHFKKGTEICNYSYSNTILAVKLNRARLVVCQEEFLYIHNIRDMRILHTIRDTPVNSKGLCALSVNSDNCFLAYPGSSTTGEVQLFDAFILQAKLMIPAHDAPLAALAFNPAGNRLATASERGTVIRIFSVYDGVKLAEFRRGVKRCAIVHSLSFSQDSQYLALSSNTETIHVFKFEEPPLTTAEAAASPPTAVSESPDTGGSWMGYFAKAVTVSASYLPTQVTDTFNQSRAIATVSLPTVDYGPNTVAIANVSKQQRLLLASACGYLYIYDIPGTEVGECVLVKQHRIDLTKEIGAETEEEVVVQDTFSSTVAKSSPIGVPYSNSHGTVGSYKDEFLDGPAVLQVTPQDSTFEESPPPTIHRPDI